jgi:hypothetical protein
MSSDQQQGAPDVDYSAFNDASVMKPVEQVKAGLQQIVDEARQYEREIAEAEAALKKSKEKYRGIMEDVLPKALREAGFGDVGFPSSDGTIITVASKVENSVPAARRNEAWDWLEKNGQGDILKREVTVPFMVKEGDKAKELQDRLAKEFMRTVVCERRAEPATLKSVLVKMMEAQAKVEGAVVVPRDLFGIREFDIAVMKAPKKKD